MQGICSVCGANGEVFSTFGKFKCRECIKKSNTGRQGHSGMIYNKNVNITDYEDISLVGLNLVLVKKSHPLFVKWFIEHYPRSKGIVGRQLNYLIYYDSHPIGIISIASPPLNYRLFREYFNVDNDKEYYNNNVFRIVNKPDDNNIGTKILKMLRQQIISDCENKYKTKPIGLVTFVEPPRTGAIYKADNWEYLGMTQGIEVRRRGSNWLEKSYNIGTPKHIFAKRL